MPLIRDGNTFKGQFIPKQEGIYELNVFEKGNPIPGHPFPLTVVPRGD